MLEKKVDDKSAEVASDLIDKLADKERIWKEDMEHLRYFVNTLQTDIE